MSRNTFVVAVVLALAIPAGSAEAATGFDVAELRVLRLEGSGIACPNTGGPSVIGIELTDGAIHSPTVVFSDFGNQNSDGTTPDRGFVETALFDKGFLEWQGTGRASQVDCEIHSTVSYPAGWRFAIGSIKARGTNSLRGITALSAPSDLDVVFDGSVTMDERTTDLPSASLGAGSHDMDWSSEMGLADNLEFTACSPAELSIDVDFTLGAVVRNAAVLDQIPAGTTLGSVDELTIEVAAVRC